MPTRTGEVPERAPLQCVEDHLGHRLRDVTVFPRSRTARPVRGTLVRLSTHAQASRNPAGGAQADEPAR